MTVEEGGTRVVRYKIHLNALIGFQVDYIFHDARCPSIPYLYNLKTMPVQMHRVRLIALVQERQSVPLSMFDFKRRNFRVRLAIDRPAVQRAPTAGNLLKDHRKGLIRSDSGSAPAKLRVTPVVFFRFR